MWIATGSTGGLSGWQKGAAHMRTALSIGDIL